MHADVTEEYYFLTFKSTHDVLKFDKNTAKKSYKTTIMPVPREVSHSCGLALRFDIGDLEKIKELSKKRNLQTEGLYKVTVSNKNRIIKELEGFH
ncbi:MAG: DUF3343 domain-containing protein [Clostridiales bacterium]|nr:DUF3343 domain-containing protein [Clostridiales bacterium]